MCKSKIKLNFLLTIHNTYEIIKHTHNLLIDNYLNFKEKINYNITYLQKIYDDIDCKEICHDTDRCKLKRLIIKFIIIINDFIDEPNYDKYVACVSYIDNEILSDC